MYGDNLILIGPDVWRYSENNVEFEEDPQLLSNWKLQAEYDGLRIRIGRWKIHGKPIVVLVDFSSFISKKDDIFKTFWEAYQLDSISGQWDYIEPAAFGYAAGKVVESFYSNNIKGKQRVVAHFHEWMTGTGIMYLKKYAPHIATLFTTHATVVGRAIAGNGQPLYGLLDTYNGDNKAREFGVMAKQSCEKVAAKITDCLTTVSEITARECKQFLERDVDIVTPMVSKMILFLRARYLI
jgi:glycogen phosphorylase/synthase